MRDDTEIFGVDGQAMERWANGGSRGWSAAGALMGRIVGGIGTGFVVDAFIDDPMTEQEAQALVTGTLTPEQKAHVQKVATMATVTTSLGGAAVAAAGAAIGAPEGLRGRAAIGAAIGGLVPFFGVPLAAIGALVATRPSTRRANPVPLGTAIGAGVLGLATLGGLTWAGTKIEASRQRAA